ncbi:MAG: hypothetical protein U0X41_06180 [Chitinophagales bacterium]
MTPQKYRHIADSLHTLKKAVSTVLLALVLLFGFNACEKNLKLNYADTEIKQVVIANLNPGAFLKVNISKSKRPDDFSSVVFLPDCKVDLYEDDLFTETLPFILKDTLSGLGYYTSSYKLRPNHVYKIISTHSSLGTVEATEYLPNIPTLLNFTLLQHADSLHPNITGQYVLTFQDSASFSNYYFLSTYYKVLKPTINNDGDTIYKYEYMGVPSYAPEIPNPGNFTRSFTSDANFDGQTSSFSVSFPSQYNTLFKEIELIIELSNTGKNFYDWNVQQLRYGTDYLNEGQLERINLKGNIINGYGHFTANSSAYIGIRIR